MKQFKKTSHILFSTLLLTTLNTLSMQNTLIPEIQGKIVTTLLNLYLDEIEDTIARFNKTVEENNLCSHFLYHRNSNKVLDKMLYWINRTIQEHTDFDVTSYKRNTTLHHVTEATLEFKSPDYMFNFVRYLLEHKANPNIQNNYGKTAFFSCIRSLEFSYSRIDITDIQVNLLNLFLNAGANPNLSSQGNTFMFILTSSPYCEPVEKIIKQTNIEKVMNTKDEYGDTLACVAAAWGNIEFLRVLANASADFSIKNANGLTPLDLALQYKKNTKKYCTAQHADDLINLLENCDKVNNQ